MCIRDSPGTKAYDGAQYFNPITAKEASPGLTVCEKDEKTNKLTVKGAKVGDTTAMPKRLAPGHGACPGCGIPVNVNPVSYTHLDVYKRQVLHRISAKTDSGILEMRKQPYTRKVNRLMKLRWIMDSRGVWSTG